LNTFTECGRPAPRDRFRCGGWHGGGVGIRTRLSVLAALLAALTAAVVPAVHSGGVRADPGRILLWYGHRLGAVRGRRLGGA